MAAASPFALNPHASVHVETVGDACPILVIDDVFADPDAVRAQALGGNYDSSMAYYPGVHARIEHEQVRPLFTQLSALLKHMSGLACRPEDFITDFSLVTTPARDMLAGQKHPHVDYLPLAGVIYLTPGSTVGTSLFRHVPTGLALLRTEQEEQVFHAWMEAEAERQQPETYAVAGSAVWECLHTIGARYNRLVMYPGNAFHSIAMTDVAPDITMETARLTQRLFVMRVGAP